MMRMKAMEEPCVRLWADAPLERPSRRRRGKSRFAGYNSQAKGQSGHITIV